MRTYCNYRYLFMLRSRVFVCTRVFEGQSMLKMHRTSLSVLGRFLFGECETLCSSVFPLQPFQCSWYYVFDMGPIKDAPRHCAYSEIGFSWNQINIYKHPWRMRWTGPVSCLGPMRTHAFAIRLFVWVCLVSKRFWCVSSLYADQLWSFQ